MECNQKNQKRLSKDSRSGFTKSTQKTIKDLSKVICNECGMMGHYTNEYAWCNLETSHKVKWFTTGGAEVTSEVSCDV